MHLSCTPRQLDERAKEYLRAAHQLGEAAPQGLLVDPLYWWEVNPHRVIVTAIDQATDVQAIHHMRNGVYQHTELKLSLPGLTRSWTVQGQERAGFIAKFCHAAIGLRAINDDAMRAEFAARPELLGRVAKALARGESPEVERLAFADKLPLLDAQSMPQSSTWLSFRRMLQVATVLVVAVIGFGLFPRLALRAKDGWLFDQLLRDSDTSVEAVDRYLSSMPQGKHIQEALELRDDRRFRKAAKISKEKRSPAGLRDYLAVAANTRHRDEAQQQINQYYEDAILRLRKLASGPDVDRDLFESLVGLLTSLKTAKTPVVTVGFKATQDAAPTTDEQRTVEQLNCRTFPTFPRARLTNTSPENMVAPAGARRPRFRLGLKV